MDPLTALRFSPRCTTIPPASIDDLLSDEGLTQLETADKLSLNKGRVNHLIKEEKLKTNGKNGYLCRVDRRSVDDYKNRRNARFK
jgi:hypothetical protein